MRGVSLSSIWKWPSPLLSPANRRGNSERAAPLPMIDRFKRILSVPLAAILLVYDAADAVFGPVVRPALAYLARLRIFQRIGDWIASLPPYAVLTLLAVPFAAIEPFKFVALYWIAEGRLVVGTLALAMAHLASIFICERILHAGREKLLTIGWFARGYAFVTRLRRAALDWLRSTAAWRAGKALVLGVKARISRFSA